MYHALKYALSLLKKHCQLGYINPCEQGPLRFPIPSPNLRRLRCDDWIAPLKCETGSKRIYKRINKILSQRWGEYVMINQWWCKRKNQRKADAQTKERRIQTTAFVLCVRQQTDLTRWGNNWTWLTPLIILVSRANNFPLMITNLEVPPANRPDQSSAPPGITSIAPISSPNYHHDQYNHPHLLHPSTTDTYILNFRQSTHIHHATLVPVHLTTTMLLQFYTKIARNDSRRISHRKAM